MTSHSPYLMRYMQPEQMYFGLPKHDGLAHFAKVNPTKLKYLVTRRFRNCTIKLVGPTRKDMRQKNSSMPLT